MIFSPPCRNQARHHVLASCSADRTVKVWDCAALSNNCLHTFSHHTNKVQSVAWNPSEPAILLVRGLQLAHPTSMPPWRVSARSCRASRVVGRGGAPAGSCSYKVATRRAQFIRMNAMVCGCRLLRQSASFDRTCAVVDVRTSSTAASWAIDADAEAAGGDLAPQSIARTELIADGS